VSDDLPAIGQAAVVTVSIGLAGARSAVRAAVAHAEESGVLIAVVVVDVSGGVVALERMDGAPFVAAALAQDKAWTAAAFAAPNDTWSGASKPDGRYWGLAGALGGRFSVLAGGVPVVLDRQTVGAVGVSGGDDEFDRACATAAAEAIGRPRG
jgi:uncharacterized protein GlcG (DUF336 family)